MNNGVENNQAVEPVLTPQTSDVNAAPSIAPMPVEAQPVMTNSGVVESTPTPVNSAVEQPTMVTQDAIPTMVVEQPVLVEAQTPTDVPDSIPVTEGTPVVEGEPILAEDQPKKKKKSGGAFLVLLIIVALGGFAFYTKSSSDKAINELNYQCTPIHETKEEKELDVNSTLVQTLYAKVATSINEDYAQPEWNDTMKIYLAYRQLADNLKYDSNCNMFKVGRMEPYICEVSTLFVPKAFTTDSLRLEWKKLYGEQTEMPLINVKLENECIGGYEYIQERDEYVQGYCKQSKAHSYRVKKVLKKAISSGNTIVLTEEATYSGEEKMTLPDYLKSGKYYYTFRLDMNYNYVLISKEYGGKIK